MQMHDTLKQRPELLAYLTSLNKTPQSICVLGMTPGQVSALLKSESDEIIQLRGTIETRGITGLPRVVLGFRQSALDAALRQLSPCGVSLQPSSAAAARAPGSHARPTSTAFRMRSGLL